MELKYIVFIIGFLTCVPLGVISTFISQKFFYVFVGLILASMLFPCDVNFYSMEQLRITARGYAVGLNDLATWIVLLAMLFHSRFKVTFFPPGWIFCLIYFALSVVATVLSPYPIISGFELWRLVSMYITYLTLYNYFKTDFNFIFFFRVSFILVMLASFKMLYQKYAQGIWQVMSYFPHQNSFAMFACAYGMIFFGILLVQGRMKKYDFFFAILGAIGSAASLAFTYSRGGLFTFALCVSGVFLCAYIFSGVSMRKVVVTLLVGLIGLGGLGYMLPRIIDRYMNAPEGSKADRIQLAQDAQVMANTKTFGVGLNLSCFFLNIDYIQDIPLHEMRATDFRRQNIETIYLMIAAEAGWPTMIAFFVMMLYFWTRGLLNIFFYRKSEYLGLFIGLFFAISGLMIQSTLEWVLRQPQNALQLMMIFAMIAPAKYMVAQSEARKAEAMAQATMPTEDGPNPPTPENPPSQITA